MNIADPSSDGHGVSSSSRELMKKSRRSSRSRHQLLQRPPLRRTLSPTLSKSRRPNRSSHIPVLPRPNRSSPLPTECHGTNVIRRETPLEAWTGSELSSPQRGPGHPSPPFNGPPELHPPTQCRRPEWLRGEDPISLIDLEVYLLLCEGRCLGRIVEGSFGDCQKSPSVSGSLCQLRKRIAVMMSSTVSMRTRNG